MKKIVQATKAFFAKDLLWKVFSIVVAIFLWFFVMNTLNPTETKTFSANITFTNESVLADNNITILNEEELKQTRVSIRVTGTRPALDELSKSENRSGITAYIDLKQLSTMGEVDGVQEVSLNVTPKLPSNIYTYSYEISSFSPNMVDAQIDSLKSEIMKVQFDVTGELASGYNADDPVCDNDTVTVTGPESEFNMVSSVRAAVDLTGKDSDLSVAVAPAVYDIDGNIMEHFTVDPSVIDVTVGISRRWQIPVEEPEVIGELDENLVLESIDYSPKYIEVEGDIDEINAVESIQLPPVDLSAVESTQTTTYDVRPSLKDTDIQLVDGSPTEVTVTVTVTAKASRDITVSGDDIAVTGLADGLSAQVNDVRLTLNGDGNVIDSLTGAQLSPSIDLSGLGSGWHSVELSITLPDKVEVRNIPTVSVFVEATEEETETTQNEEGEVTEETEAATEEETETAVEEETSQDET